jgi:hypothetical protein
VREPARRVTFEQNGVGLAGVFEGTELALGSVPRVGAVAAVAAGRLAERFLGSLGCSKFCAEDILEICGADAAIAIRPSRREQIGASRPPRGEALLKVHIERGNDGRATRRPYVRRQTDLAG